MRVSRIMLNNHRVMQLQVAYRRAGGRYEERNIEGTAAVFAG
jgi:hypothetical protein